MATYTPWIKTDIGEPLAPLDRHYGFSYVKTLNGIGHFAIQIPEDSKVSKDVLVADSLQPDRQIQFWRKTDNQTNPALDFMGFLRKWTFHTAENGDSVLYLSGPDQNELLKRRIVAYAAGENEAKITNDPLAGTDKTVDEGMVNIIRENLGADATDSDRDLSALNFSVKWSDDEGPAIKRSFAWKQVDRIIAELSQTSRALGTEIFWIVNIDGVDSNGEIVLNFMATDQAIGGDRTWKPEPLGKMMIFGLRWGNLLSPTVEYDYTNEVNYVYGGGPGEGLERQIVEVSDTTRMEASKWNRREAFADARQAKTAAEITAKANEVLNKGRPKIRFKGTILSTEQTPYGEWGLGSRVTIEYRNIKFNGLIRNVLVAVDANGVETVTSNVEFEELI